MSFSIIAAISSNTVIGKDNKLPWDIPEDLIYFHSLVSGKVVVMGRKTYESIGHAIKKSQNVVLSHDIELQLPDCKVVHSISEILDLYKDSDEEIMVIGGAEIYQQFLSFADKMYLTFIHSDIDGNVFFPDWQPKQWEIIDKRDSSDEEHYYSFVVLQRKRG